MLKQSDCVKERENASDQVVIGISLASNWLRKWRKCSGPIITLQFPQLWLVHWLFYFSLIILKSCNSIVEAADHIKSTQLNSPITELIKITIATTTYPRKNWRISKMEEYFNFRHCFHRRYFSRCIFLFENSNGND